MRKVLKFCAFLALVVLSLGCAFYLNHTEFGSSVDLAFGSELTDIKVSKVLIEAIKRSASIVLP